MRRRRGSPSLRNRSPLRWVILSGERSPCAAPVSPSTSSAINRSAVKPILQCIAQFDGSSGSAAIAVAAAMAAGPATAKTFNLTFAAPQGEHMTPLRGAKDTAGPV